MSVPEFDLAAIYTTAHERLVALAPQLDAAQRATTVPTCPAWTVHDTYAHLAGLAADATGGQTGYLGTDENTAAQVERGRDRSLEAVCDEWGGTAAAMASFVADHRISPLAIDAWTHDQDIHNALGIVSGREGPGLELTLSAVWRLKRRFREEGVAPLRVVTGDHDWLIGNETAATTLRIAPYELARMALGRRSRRQMLAYEWEGDPEPYVTMLPFFRPPDVDIVE